MKILYGLFFIGFLLTGCKEKTENIVKSEKKVVFNAKLAEELKEMYAIDQVAAYIRQGKYATYTVQEWQAFKDSVFTTHGKRIGEIFDSHGFVGFNLAGEEGSRNFWIMVQHSDHNPEFQREVLEKMKIEVERKNASPENYAYLVDRVKLNTGEKQIYGTQFDYNEYGQAFPKNLFDSINIDKRRASVGLKPMLERMNEMTRSHFLMNKAYFAEKGITEPKLYKQE